MTTPTGSDTQLRTTGSGGPRRAGSIGPARRARRSRRRYRTAGRRAPADPSAACSRWRRDRPRFRGRRSPVRCRPARGRCARNSAPFAAARQASVAIRRARVTDAAAHLVATNASAVTARGDRGVRKPSGRRYAFAEPDDAGEGVETRKLSPDGPRNQQAAIVGAEVERGIGLASALADGRRRWREKAAATPRGGPSARGRSGAGSRSPVARPSSSIECLSTAPKSPATPRQAAWVHPNETSVTVFRAAANTSRPSVAPGVGMTRSCKERKRSSWQAHARSSRPTVPGLPRRPTRRPLALVPCFPVPLCGASGSTISTHRSPRFNA